MSGLGTNKMNGKMKETGEKLKKIKENEGMFLLCQPGSKTLPGLAFIM